MDLVAAKHSLRTVKTGLRNLHQRRLTLNEDMFHFSATAGDGRTVEAVGLAADVDEQADMISADTTAAIAAQLLIPATPWGPHYRRPAINHNGT